MQRCVMLVNGQRDHLAGRPVSVLDMAPSKKLMMAWLADTQLGHLERYVKAGRRYRSLSQEELFGHWVAVYRRLASDPFCESDRQTSTDLEGEFQLRQLEPPFDLVKHEVEVFGVAVMARMGEITKDPTESARINAEI